MYLRQGSVGRGVGGVKERRGKKCRCKERNGRFTLFILVLEHGLGIIFTAGRKKERKEEIRKKIKDDICRPDLANRAGGTPPPKRRSGTPRDERKNVTKARCSVVGMCVNVWTTVDSRRQPKRGTRRGITGSSECFETGAATV